MQVEGNDATDADLMKDPFEQILEDNDATDADKIPLEKEM